ncbi:MAG: glycosyltransferase [Clostridia bacterium]|nr:glycosyltransferase [Clostridia bacterium]
MVYTEKDHVFAICAYKESRYLEECVETLEQQTARGRLIMCTATPNDHIAQTAARHGLPLFINDGPHGIAEDWNFAYAHADAPLVTLAHQDDVYEPDYLRKILEKLNAASHPLIAFSDYFELRNGRKVFQNENRNLKIKSIALIPLRFGPFQKSRWVRRRVLSLCDPICCPAVTYVKPNLPEVMFESHFRSDLDWQAWEKISKMPGSFCYIREPLMGHRIHEESTTTEVIGANNNRSSEDLEMYMKFWPKPIARFINRFYSASQKGNQL